MSDAFQHGWALVKMATYKVGPTEFWDKEEDNKGRSWREPGIDGETNFYPMGGSPVYGSHHTKTMMKPQDYLRLTSPIKGNHKGEQMYGSTLQDYVWWDKKENQKNPRTEDIIQGMKEGKPTYIPNLRVASNNDVGLGKVSQSRDIVGHEGRHRMAAILQLLGNVPVPIELSSNYFPDMKRQLILQGIPLRGQYDEEQLLDIDPELMLNVGDVQ